MTAVPLTPPSSFFNMYSVTSPTSLVEPHRLQEPEADSPTHFTPSMSTTPGDGSFLSPHSIFNPYSNSSSPSNLGTSVELTSDTGGYSDFTEYNGDDEFYGVDFDANIGEIDFATAILGEAPVSSIEPPFISSPSDLTLVEPTVQSVPTRIRFSHSPDNTTTSNPESPKGTSTAEIISGEPISAAMSGFTNPSTQNWESKTPENTTNFRGAMDTSGDSHPSDEGFDPTVATFMDHSPRVTLTPWGSMDQQEISAESGPI